METRTIRGAAMVFAAAMLWGTTGTAQSFAPPQLPAAWVGALRLVIAALFFWPALAAGDRGALSADAMRRLPVAPLALAAACMAAYNLAFFAGVRACGVAVGTAIALGSGPVWAGVLQALVHRAVPPRGWWIGTAMAVGGVVLMSLGGAAPASPSAAARLDLAGVLACLLAGLSYATYALVNQRLVARASPGAVTAVVFTGAALMALPGAALIAGAPALHGADLPVVAWLGVVSTGIAYLLFSHALRHVSAATGVALTLGEPVTAFVLAVLVVGEHPGRAGAAGLVAVVLGLWVVLRSE